jgi:hypothetical protein
VILYLDKFLEMYRQGDMQLPIILRYIVRKVAQDGTSGDDFYQLHQHCKTRSLRRSSGIDTTAGG